MDKYLLMMYLTLEQETAVRHLFLCRGWKYSKQDLSKTTEEVGPPDIDKVKHKKGPQGAAAKTPAGQGTASKTKKRGRPPKIDYMTGLPKAKVRNTGSANAEPSLEMECVDGSSVSLKATPTATEGSSNNSSVPSSAATETTSPRRSSRAPKPNLVYLKQEHHDDTDKEAESKTGSVIPSPSSSSAVKVVDGKQTSGSDASSGNEEFGDASDNGADMEMKDEDYGDDDDDFQEEMDKSLTEDSATPTAGSSGEGDKAGAAGNAPKPKVTFRKNYPSKRRNYPISMKLEAIAYAEIHGNRAAGRKFGTSEKNVRFYRQQKETLQKASLQHMNMKRYRPKDLKSNSIYENMETELCRWMVEEAKTGRTLTMFEVQKEALSLARSPVYNYTEFKASKPWLHRFLRRHRLDVEIEFKKSEKVFKREDFI